MTAIFMTLSGRVRVRFARRTTSPTHADAPARLVFDDVKTALGLPFLDTGYRAKARWPSHSALAWADLRPRLQRGECETFVAEVHEAAVSAVRSLPNDGNLSGDALRLAARSSAPDGDVLSVVRLFQWLLPGLVTNIAFFRAPLGTDTELLTAAAHHDRHAA
jgi:hypothetical protein